MYVWRQYGRGKCQHPRLAQGCSERLHRQVSRKHHIRLGSPTDADAMESAGLVLATTNLLSVGLDDVVILHVQVIWSLVWLDPDTVVQESQRIHFLALSLGKGLHQSSQRGGPLDLEENLGRAIGNLQVDVGFWLNVWLGFWLGSGVGHGSCDGGSL